VSQRKINRRTHRCHLGSIALLWRCPRAVGIDLGGRLVWGVGDACTETELLERVVDDSRRDYEVDPAFVTYRVLVDKLQRAVHAAGFVAVDAPRHQGAGECAAPAAALDGEQGILGLLLYPSSNCCDRSRYCALGQALRHLRGRCPQALHLQIHFCRYGKRTNTPSPEGLGLFLRL
jgi:hypothetical protein